jgi:hypothetical protein
MQAFHLLIVITLIGVSCEEPTKVPQSTLLASAVAPQGPASLAAPYIPIVLRTDPAASCTLYQGERDPAKQPRLFADDLGTVRFSFGGALDSFAAMNFKLDCTSTGGTPLPTRMLDSSSLVTDPGPVGNVVPALTGDPLVPSQNELRKRGYPPRPDPTANPDNYAMWLKMVSVDTTLVNGRSVVVPGGQRNNPENSQSWSGIVLNHTLAQYFDTVLGYFNEPTLNATTFPGTTEYLASVLWVGLDGSFNNPVVEQAGVEADQEIYKDSQGVLNPVQYSFGWVEWFPDPPHSLANFPVLPGDSLYAWVSANVWVDDGDSGYYIFDPNNMHYGIYNLTRSTQVLGCIGTVANGCALQPTMGQQATGHNAEWIYERPSQGTYFDDFPDYGTSSITGAQAEAVGDLAWHNWFTEPYDNFTTKAADTDILSTASAAGTSTAPVVNFTWKGFD